MIAWAIWATSLLKWRNNVKSLPGIGQSREVCLEGVASQVLGRVLKPSCRTRNDYFNVEDIVEIVLKASCGRRNDYFNVEEIVEIVLKPSCSRRNDYFNVEDIVEIVLKPSCRNDYFNVEYIVKPSWRSTNDHFEVEIVWCGFNKHCLIITLKNLKTFHLKVVAKKPDTSQIRASNVLPSSKGTWSTFKQSN